MLSVPSLRNSHSTFVPHSPESIIVVSSANANGIIEQNTTTSVTNTFSILPANIVISPFKSYTYKHTILFYHFFSVTSMTPKLFHLLWCSIWDGSVCPISLHKLNTAFYPSSYNTVFQHKTTGTAAKLPCLLFVYQITFFLRLTFSSHAITRSRGSIQLTNSAISTPIPVSTIRLREYEM